MTQTTSTTIFWRETTEMLWAKEPLIHMRMWFDK